jgi:hypothetical protein
MNLLDVGRDSSLQGRYLHTPQHLCREERECVLTPNGIILYFEWKRCKVQLRCDGTRWCTGGELKGKLANGVGSQYPSHYLETIVYPALLTLMRTPRLPVVDWTEAPADLNGLVRFAERRNLVSARVPSHFKRSLPFESEFVRAAEPIWTSGEERNLFPLTISKPGSSTT